MLHGEMLHGQMLHGQMILVLVTGGKQSQLLVLGLRLEFDNFGTVETNL